MRGIARQFLMENADYIKLRRLSRHPQFRLDENYLFHNFLHQELSNFYNSVSHMIRTVRPNQSAIDFLDRLQHRDSEIET